MIRGDKDLMSLFWVSGNDFRKDWSNYRGSMPTFLNMTDLWTMSQLGWMNQNEPARAHEFWCALKCGASCCEGVYSLKGKLRITHVMAVIAQMFGFKVPWECRLRDTMPSKAVSRKHARSRVWKMILSWLSASVDDALVALNFSVATLFAVYIGIRCGSKQAVRRGKQLLNPSLTLGGEILDFATCCRNTDTHDVLKEDPITGFIDAYWRFDVRNGWQTVPIRTAACCGSSDTGEKITTEIRRWRGVSKASIRPSGHIDNGQGHSDRVLKNGKRKRTNYDSSHWDVGAAARDLLRVGVTATNLLGRKARRVQPVPHAPNLSPPVL